MRLISLAVQSAWARRFTLSVTVLAIALGFTGVVVTDDVAMGAVAKHWKPAQMVGPGRITG